MLCLSMCISNLLHQAQRFGDRHHGGASTITPSLLRELLEALEAALSAVGSGGHGAALLFIEDILTVRIFNSLSLFHPPLCHHREGVRKWLNTFKVDAKK